MGAVDLRSLLLRARNLRSSCTWLSTGTESRTSYILNVAQAGTSILSTRSTKHSREPSNNTLIWMMLWAGSRLFLLSLAQVKRRGLPTVRNNLVNWRSTIGINNSRRNPTWWISVWVGSPWCRCMAQARQNAEKQSRATKVTNCLVSDQFIAVSN